MEETRELIEVDDEPKESHTYCYCTKELYRSRNCSANYVFLFCSCIPMTTLVDTLVCLPQLISNNIKICANQNGLWKSRTDSDM